MLQFTLRGVTLSRHVAGVTDSALYSLNSLYTKINVYSRSGEQRYEIRSHSVCLV